MIQRTSEELWDLLLNLHQQLEYNGNIPRIDRCSWVCASACSATRQAIEPKQSVVVTINGSASKRLPPFSII